MPKILLAAHLDPRVEARLEAAAEIVRPAALDEAALCAAIPDCAALIVRTNIAVTRALLEAGRRLKVVGVAGVGLDRVDVAAADELAITVLNTPGAASDAVAELTIAFMLQLLRPVPELNAAYRDGRFHAARKASQGVELRTLTVGIIGMGRIGARVGRICAAGFGARVIYHDIAEVGPFAFPAERVDLQTLSQQSNIVTLHVPLTPHTRGMIDAQALAALRRGARLINTARGSVVQSAALQQALRDGHLAGAALDVTDPEPLPPSHPLWKLPTCIITPHIAARTHGGMARMEAVADDVLAHLREIGALNA